MIRVISSPSSSTIGFLTLILAIAGPADAALGVEQWPWLPRESGQVADHVADVLMRAYARRPDWRDVRSRDERAGAATTDRQPVVRSGEGGASPPDLRRASAVSATGARLVRRLRGRYDGSAATCPAGRTARARGAAAPAGGTPRSSSPRQRHRRSPRRRSRCRERRSVDRGRISPEMVAPAPTGADRLRRAIADLEALGPSLDAGRRRLRSAPRWRSRPALGEGPQGAASGRRAAAGPSCRGRRRGGLPEEALSEVRHRRRSYPRRSRHARRILAVATVERPKPRATHEVVNQPLPLEDYNIFEADRLLVEAVRREGAAGPRTAVRELGRAVRLRAGDPLGLRGEPEAPELRTHDRFGHRIDEVEFDSSWHELMGIGDRPRPACAALARAAVRRPRRPRGAVHAAGPGRGRRRLPDLDDLLGDPGAARAAGDRRGVGAALPLARLRPAVRPRRREARGALRDGDDREAGRLRRARQHDAWPCR